MDENKTGLTDDESPDTITVRIGGVVTEFFNIPNFLRQLRGRVGKAIRAAKKASDTSREG